MTHHTPDTPSPIPQHTYLRLPQLRDKTGLATSTIYDFIAKGKLPRPRKLGKCSLWIESEVDAAIAGGAQ